MLVAVNTRFLLKDKLEGIGWFTYETIKRLTQNHPEHQFLFLFDRDFDQEFVFSENIIPLKVWPPARHPYLWKYWYDFALPKVFRKYKPDLFVSTDGMLSLKSHVPTLLVIHDLGFEHYPEHTPPLVSRYYRKFTPLYAKRAARIVTVSEFSKQDIVKRYHIDANKIDVVYNGANELYRPITEMEKQIVKKKLTGGKNYFIYVGSIHPRKNLKNLLLAYDMLRKEGFSDHKLVIVGRQAWQVEETHTVYESMSYKDDVIFTGHQQMVGLTHTMAAADALVFPSFLEGFGIPIVEAKRSGVPLILSNSSSLPEVGGADAIYFNPYHPEEIKNAMREFITNRSYYQQRAAALAAEPDEFNWDLAAENLYRSVQICMAKITSSKKKIAAY